MINFFHKLFNPHCEHCAEERREAKYCSSCDTLRRQLELKTYECEELLNRLLNPPIPEVTEKTPVEVTRPARNVTWGIRQRLLEQEDRARAASIKRAAVLPVSNDKIIPDKSSSIAELERELGVQGENGGIEDAIR